HNWLTDAYPEATPTGTVLLSAFTTKLAIYALARAYPGAEPLVYIGAAMTVFPIFYAVIENDNSPGVSYEDRWREVQAGQPGAVDPVGNVVYRTDDGGDSWRRTTENTVGERDNYYGRIVVDPGDENTVYVMASMVHKSTDGGRSWSRAFEYGGDNHALWIDPDNRDHMLLGYDYGFAMSFDSGANWQHLDNVSMAQIYAIGVDMEYPYNVYGGLQDFGSWKGPSVKKGRFPIRFEDWEHVQGGDGFYNQVDPTNGR
ncbi:MAG: hypothetical protein IIA67_03870, partial [Planctomycetes bacterium]|nr:hypothetical protein [Planctomycetota bacterium]